MRLIEARMLAALQARTNWRGVNTEVRRMETFSEVLLHDNLIARVWDAGQLDFTLAGWNTRTTLSRLNAILREHERGYVFQKKGRPLYAASVDYTPRALSETEWEFV